MGHTPAVSEITVTNAFRSRAHRIYSRPIELHGFSLLDNAESFSVHMSLIQTAGGHTHRILVAGLAGWTTGQTGEWTERR